MVRLSAFRIELDAEKSLVNCSAQYTTGHPVVLQRGEAVRPAISGQFLQHFEDVGMLERKIERRLKQALGYNVPVFIRTHAELKKIAALELLEDSEIHGADLNIILLAGNLDERSKAELVSLTTETDGFRVHGREVYWWRRKKPGTSLFSTVPLAKVLCMRFTMRSTSTIRKLVAKWP